MIECPSCGFVFEVSDAEEVAELPRVSPYAQAKAWITLAAMHEEPPEEET